MECRRFVTFFYHVGTENVEKEAKEKDALRLSALHPNFYTPMEQLTLDSSGVTVVSKEVNTQLCNLQSLEKDQTSVPHDYMIEFNTSEDKIRQQIKDQMTIKTKSNNNNGLRFLDCDYCR